MLDEDFSTDWYAAILGNLRDNGYLTQEDVDILQCDSPNLTGIGQEKAEIVRNAIFENSKRKSN